MTRTIASFAIRLTGHSLAALTLTLTLAAAQSPKLRIYRIDVEQADSARLVSPNTNTLMTVTCVASSGAVIGEQNPTQISDENDNSVALLITFGGFRYFTGGDIERHNESTCCGPHLKRAPHQSPGGSWE